MLPGDRFDAQRYTPRRLPADSPRLRDIEIVIANARAIEDADGSFGGALVEASVYHNIGRADSYTVTGFQAGDGAVLALTMCLQRRGTSLPSRSDDAI
jgi:hypothetical protein